MAGWNGLSAGQVAWLLFALAVAVSGAVGLLIAVGVAEVRSRRGEAERVAAIRRRRTQEPRQARREAGVRS